MFSKILMYYSIIYLIHSLIKKNLKKYRKEKNRESDPSQYMNNLDNWRNCGSPGYVLKFPSVNNYVYASDT